MKCIQVKDSTTNLDVLINIESIVAIGFDEDGMTMIQTGFDRRCNPIGVETKQSYGIIKQKLVELGVEIK